MMTERTDHPEALADRLSRFAKNVIVLSGGQCERKRREAIDRLAAIPAQDERVIVATGRYLGEGLDDQRLDTFFLTMPMAWRGTLAQDAGRLHRLHEPSGTSSSMTMSTATCRSSPAWPPSAPPAIRQSATPWPTVPDFSHQGLEGLYKISYRLGS